MHTGVKQTAASVLLRVAGTFIGATVSAFCAAILFFIAAILDLVSGINFQVFLSAIALAGACVGFLRPRKTLDALPFFFPEIFESH